MNSNSQRTCILPAGREPISIDQYTFLEELSGNGNCGHVAKAHPIPEYEGFNLGMPEVDILVVASTNCGWADHQNGAGQPAGCPRTSASGSKTVHVFVKRGEAMQTGRREFQVKFRVVPKERDLVEIQSKQLESGWGTIPIISEQQERFFRARGVAPELHDFVTLKVGKRSYSHSTEVTLQFRVAPTDVENGRAGRFDDDPPTKEAKLFLQLPGKRTLAKVSSGSEPERTGLGDIA